MLECGELFIGNPCEGLSAECVGVGFRLVSPLTSGGRELPACGILLDEPLAFQAFHVFVAGGVLFPESVDGPRCRPDEVLSSEGIGVEVGSEIPQLGDMSQELSGGARRHRVVNSCLGEERGSGHNQRRGSTLDDARREVGEGGKVAGLSPKVFCGPALQGQDSLCCLLEYLARYELAFCDLLEQAELNVALSVESDERTALIACEKLELSESDMPRRKVSCGRDDHGSGRNPEPLHKLAELRIRSSRSVNAESDAVNLWPQRPEPGVDQGSEHRPSPRTGDRRHGRWRGNGS